METDIEIKSCLMSGQDLSNWHKKKIKQNNRKWFILVMLICIIFIGKDIINHNKIDSIIDKNKKNDSILKARELQIMTLQMAVDSAVYYHEIIKNGTNK